MTRKCMAVILFLMILRPPITTRTDTLVPYTTPCLSEQYLETKEFHASQNSSYDEPIEIDVFDFSSIVEVISNASDDDIKAAIGKEQNESSLCVTLRSEEHTSELQSLMRISYAVFCLKKQTTKLNTRKLRHLPHT